MNKTRGKDIDIIISGINRFLSEGYSHWSRENFRKLLSASPEIDEEELIRNWQKKDFIELVDKDDVYIRVLKEIE